MTLISNNIKFLRKLKGWTQEELAEKIGIKRSLIGAYEEGRADPRLNNLTKMVGLFETTVDKLISHDISRLPASEWNTSGTKRGKEVLAITVGEDHRENIELVPQKAAAGYLNGYSDAEYIKELPRFRLPVLPDSATYRAFEISGDSMLPIMPGTIIIGEYIDDLMDIKSGKAYVLVTRSEGIVYKRVFNYLDENNSLFLVSDNRRYAPYKIDAEDVLEVWQGKAYISVSFPDVKEENDISVEQLASVVLDLQKQIFELKRT